MTSKPSEVAKLRCREAVHFRAILDRASAVCISYGLPGARGRLDRQVFPPEHCHVETNCSFAALMMLPTTACDDKWLTKAWRKIPNSKR